MFSTTVEMHNKWIAKIFFCNVMLIIGINNCVVAQLIEFTERDGEENPLGNVTTVSSVISSPVDIDNDDDFDLFSGNGNGGVVYYKNIGTEENPNVYEEQLGIANPLGNVSFEGNILPVFIDIDKDTDLDVFLGCKNKIGFYKNIGSISNPIFEEQLNENNPLNSISHVGDKSYFTSFVDIDGDSDLDVFIGWIDLELSENGQGILYYKNTGTSSSPIFENQENENNPFINFNKLYPIPTFVDIDGDLDQDVFIEKGNGNYLFYENTSDIPIIGIDGVEFDNYGMYPNPATTDVTFNSIESTSQIRFYTITGQEVYRTVVTKENKTIHIESLASGIYLVIIDAGLERITKKLVVTK